MVPAARVPLQRKSEGATITSACASSGRLGQTSSIGGHYRDCRSKTPDSQSHRPHHQLARLKGSTAMSASPKELGLVKWPRKAPTIDDLATGCQFTEDGKEGACRSMSG
jgi:hypothetical protein